METPKICTQTLTFLPKGIKENPLLSGTVCLLTGALAAAFFCRSTSSSINGKFTAAFENISQQVTNIAKSVTQFVNHKTGTEEETELPADADDVAADADDVAADADDVAASAAGVGVGDSSGSEEGASE